MCNTCNTGYTTAYSSRCNGCQNCGCQNYARQNCGCNFCGCWLLNWLFNNNTASTQSVCRDCNGCLRIVNRSCGCGCCHHSCGCARSNGCGCTNATATANNGNGNGNGNGFYGCYSVCGRIGNGYGATSANVQDSSYARQYGLTRDSGSCGSCNCGFN